MIKNQIKKFRVKNLLIILLLIVILLMLLTISESLRAIVFVFAFIILNSLLALYKRYIHIPIEFEFLTFGIVLCSVSFGIWAGLMVGILGGIIMSIISTSFSPFTLPMMLGYCVMAFFSAYVPIPNIVYLGIFANIIHNVLVFSVYHFFFSYDMLKNFSFSISNILFNTLLFLNLGKFIKNII